LPYGDAIGVSAFTDDQTDEVWRKLREENADRTSPACKGGPDVFVCVDEKPKSKFVRNPDSP
jgi:hypothetical protein